MSDLSKLAHGGSFVKSDGRKLLKSLFKKEQMSKEQREQFALGHKKGEKLSITYEKYEFLKQITLFLQAIHSNNKQITHIALF